MAVTIGSLDGTAAGAMSVPELVATVADIPQGRVRPESRIGIDLGLDSLTRIELLAAIEAELGVALDDRVDEGTTVAEIQALVLAAETIELPRFQTWPTRPACRTLRAFVQSVALFPLLGWLCGPRARGVEWLAGIKTPVIFAPNHGSHLDAPLLLGALPGAARRRTAVAAAADYFFTRPWLGTLVSVLLNAFPFAREGPVRPSLEWCGRLLDDGWSLVVFPEGTRSPDGEIAPFRPGIGLMALELDVPIVPVRLRGAHNAWPKGRALPRRGSVTIEFGRPLRFRHGTDYAHAIRILEAAVRAL